VVPEPALFWLFVDSIVFTAVSVPLQALLGADRPLTTEAGEQGRLWRTIDRIPAAGRSRILENIRLYEVSEVIRRYGLDIAGGALPLQHLRGFGDRLAGTRSTSVHELSTPAKVRLMLQQLGPTYVKLGQMVAGRRELLTAEWSAELSKLQSNVPPFPWATAEAIIEAELGKAPDQLFASIDHEPLGAASLAQVHRAALPMGQAVVVKVQRPDVQAMVRADLGVMDELAIVAEEKFEIARRISIHDVIEEFADGVRDELDYTIEAYNARRLKDVLADIKGVSVPTVYPSLSSRKVLVMDFVPGIKATRADELDPSIDRQEVGRTLVRALIKQLLVDGFFHADPHPGNVMLDPANGSVMFLDLGLMGTLRQEQRIDLLALIWALRSGDPQLLTAVVRRLCVAVGPVEDESFGAAMEQIYYRAWIYGGGAFGAVMSSLFMTLGDHNLRMRRELVLAIKAVTQAEELLRAIAPGMPLVQVIADEAHSLIRAELTQRVDELMHGDLAGAVKTLIAEVPTIERQFIPRLIQVAGLIGLGRAAAPAVDLRPLERRLEDLNSSVDRQLGLIAVSMLLAGIAAIAGLGLLAFFIRADDALSYADLIALLIAAGVALLLWSNIQRIRQARRVRRSHWGEGPF
jgi:ubiquinone biosynthesis protein